MNVHSSPVIRRANQDDAATLARLIDIAGDGIPNWFWSRTCVEGQTPLEVGTERARRSTGGFSYRNAMIAETGAKTLGMVLSYAVDKAPEDDPEVLPAPIAPFIALEKLSVDTWYINALAVFADSRCDGTGSQLMAAAENLAKINGMNTVSIQVYGQNVRAVRLYERLGYEFAAKSPVLLHPSPPYYTGDVLLLKKTLDRQFIKRSER